MAGADRGFIFQSYNDSWGETLYPTVVAEVEGARWLVMVGLDSIMETAFPPEDPETYLANLRFQRLGTLEELGL